MSGEQTPNVVVSEGRLAGSGLSSLTAAIVAVVAQLLLLDGAVETFWSGSPLRWLIAPVVVAFVALSVWLWRPGGVLARRGGWAMAAATSVSGLLLLFVATAWLPAGQSDSVRMLAQPTPVLLSVVTAVAVALAAFALVRAVSFLPATPRLVTRAVVLALAAYAIVALGLGVRDHTPYATLFHGGALWQRLPSWLQGAFIGALVLLPLAILGQVARIIVEFGRKQPVRVLIQQTIALALVFVMATSGIVAPVGGGPAGGASSAPLNAKVSSAFDAVEQSRENTAALLTGVPAGVSVSPAAAADKARLLFDSLEAMGRRLPRDTFDPEAIVGQVGREPSKLLEWVRDRTYWAPYRGELRGAVGVLMDRVGNSLDTALLLAALLQAAGRTARLAHSTLSAEQASAYLANVRAVPVDPLADTRDASAQAEQQAIDEAVQALHVDADRLRLARAQSAKAIEAMAQTFREDSDRQAALLVAAIGTRAASPGNSAQDAAADHWWVQVQDDSNWLDLDPGPPQATAGGGLVPDDTPQPSELPATLRHQVEIKVVIEQASDGELHQHVALTETLQPSDILGQRVALTHMPVNWKPGPDFFDGADALHRAATALAEEREWLPVLTVGDTQYKERGFTTGGSLTDGTAGGGDQTRPSPGAVHDMFGFFGSEEGAEKKPHETQEAQATSTDKGHLTAEWIEYEIKAPGQAPVVSRREVFDLIGPAARVAWRGKAVVLDETRRRERALALFGETTFLALPCRLSREFVTSLVIRAMLANRDVIIALLQPQDSSRRAAFAELLSRVVPLPGPLYELALARDDWSPVRRQTFLNTVNLLTFHRRMVDSGRPGIVSLQAFDIVANNVGVLPAARLDPFEVRLRQGVTDGNAEAYLLPRCCGGNPDLPGGALARATLAGASWAAIRTDAEARRLQVSDDARTRLLGDVATGYLAVAPSGTPAADAWWRVDPKTGQTLAVGSRGWGQSTTEMMVQYGRGAIRIYVTIGCMTYAQSLAESSPKRWAFWMTVCAAAGVAGVGNLFSAGMGAWAIAGDIIAGVMMTAKLAGM